MVEDGYRRRTNLHRDKRGYRTDTGGKERKSSIGLTGVQTVLCVLVIAAAVVLRLVGGNIYSTARSAVSGAISSNVTQSDVSEAFAAIKSNFPDMKSVFSSSGQSASGSSASGSKTGASGGSSSSSSSKVSSSSTPSSSGSSTANTTVNNTQAGSTVEADAALSGTFATPQNCSTGTYQIDGKPIWPVNGSISSGFGFRIHPITGKPDFHKGIDIAAAKGTPVVAALTGSVEATGTSSTLGNYIIVNSGNGTDTIYGHLNTVLVQKGERVPQASTIAEVGTTGESTGYHLHFAIRLNGIYVNPLLSLPQTK